MRLVVGVFLVFCLLVEVVGAAPPGDGPPPAVTQHVAKMTLGGDLWLQSVAWRQVTETSTVEAPYTVDVPVFENGKKKLVKETRMRLVTKTDIKFVSEPIVQPVNTAGAKFFEVGGKQLDVAAVTAKLRSETRVLVSSTQELPPADVLQVFQPGTLVLALPPRNNAPPELAPNSEPTAKNDASPAFMTPPPQRLAPHLTFASVSRDGRLKLTNRWKVQFESTVVRTIEKPGGADQQVPEIIRGTDLQTRVRELSAAAARFYETDGTPVPAANAAERLKQETLLLESCDSELPDPFYLQLLRKGTLVMTLPREKPKE